MLYRNSSNFLVNPRGKEKFEKNPHFRALVRNVIEGPTDLAGRQEKEVKEEEERRRRNVKEND